MNYLKEVTRVGNVNDLLDEYPDGVLVATDNQAVINECRIRKLPVVAFEHEGVSNLSCSNILIDIDEVDDQIFENIYRREKGIPWDIAETARTYIREYSPADLDALFDLYASHGSLQYMENLYEYEAEKAYELDYIEYIYKIYGFGQWLVFDKVSHELIGRAGIECRDSCYLENQAELGYLIRADRLRQGLAYEVCSKIIELAFHEYGMTSLIARTHPDNLASINLLKKLGFTLDASLEGEDRYIMYGPAH